VPWSQILINGVNFGANLTGNYSITYRVNLDPILNSSLPFVPVGNSTNGTIVFQPINCVMSIPHIQIGTWGTDFLQCSFLSLSTHTHSLFHTHAHTQTRSVLLHHLSPSTTTDIDLRFAPPPSSPYLALYHSPTQSA
jgi:hypothetical protein